MNKEIALKHLKELEFLDDVISNKLSNLYERPIFNLKKMDKFDTIALGIFLLAICSFAVMVINFLLIELGYLTKEEAVIPSFLIIGFSLLFYSCGVYISNNKKEKESNELLKVANNIYFIKNVDNIVDYRESLLDTKYNKEEELKNDENFIKISLKSLKENDKGFKKYEDKILCLSERLTAEKIKRKEKENRLNNMHQVLVGSENDKLVEEEFKIQNVEE